MQVRAVVLASVLVVSGLGGAALVADEAGEGTEGITVEDEGRSVAITDEALPADTGYAIATLTLPANATVQIERESTVNRSGSATAFTPVFSVHDHVPNLHTIADDPDARFEASHDGREVACCDELSQQGGELYETDRGHDYRTSQPVTVRAGLIAHQWPEDASFAIEITVDDGQLSLDDTAVGEEVSFLDLVDQARREGTHVETHGQQVVSEPADVEETIEVDHTGLVGLRADMDGQARANLSLELPNGTTVTTNDGREESVFASAATSPGSIEIHLTDVRDPGMVDERREAFSSLSAELLVADVPLELHGLHAHVLEEGVDLPDHPQRVTFTGEELPAEDGWFLAEITTNRSAALAVASEVTMNASGEGPIAAVPLILSEHRAQPFSLLTNGGPRVSANAEDLHVECCSPATSRAPSQVPATASLSLSGLDTVNVGPDRPVYVGLAAAGFQGEDQAEIRVQPHPDEPATTVDVHVVVDGTEVKAIDLVDRAKGNGNNANVATATVAGDAGDAHAQIDADGSALTLLDLYASGSQAHARATVELPNGTVVEAGGQDTAAEIEGLSGPGTVDVHLRDVQVPTMADRATSEETGHLRATLVQADLPVPFRTLEVREHTLDG